MAFSTLGLSEPLLRAVSGQSYTIPTPIQSQAIPVVLAGRDLMAAAQTGTGKTAGFTLPLLHRLSGGERVQPNAIRALVLTPTRELAAQVGESVATYGKHLPLRSAVIYGGVSINPQMMALRRGVDVLIATPGRLLDLYSQNAVKFSQLEILVLDEADRMLDMGFIRDIKKIMALLPKRRQTLMFSATFSDDIRKLGQELLNQPAFIEVSPRNAAATTVKQWVHPVDQKRKPELLSHLVHHHGWEQVLVFTRTKHGANRVAAKLEQDGIKAAAIHGNKSQGARTKALADFKQGGVRVLVATDIASRGLDIDQLPQVVNFDLPHVAEDYVHRIGRTGRAGATGQAVSLVSIDEKPLLNGIEKLIRQVLPREMIEGFEPDANFTPAPLKPPHKPRPARKPGAKPGFKPQGNRAAPSSQPRAARSNRQRTKSG